MVYLRIRKSVYICYVLSVMAPYHGVRKSVYISPMLRALNSRTSESGKVCIFTTMKPQALGNLLALKRVNTYMERLMDAKHTTESGKGYKFASMKQLNLMGNFFTTKRVNTYMQAEFAKPFQTHNTMSTVKFTAAAARLSGWHVSAKGALAEQLAGMLPEFTQFASGILEAWVNEDGDEVITHRSFNYHMLTIKAFARKALEALVATLWTPEQLKEQKISSRVQVALTPITIADRATIYLVIKSPDFDVCGVIELPITYGSDEE